MQVDRLITAAFIIRCQNILTSVEELLPPTAQEMAEKILSGDKKVNFLIEQLRGLARIKADYELAEKQGGIHPTRLENHEQRLAWLEATLKKGPKDDHRL